MKQKGLINHVIEALGLDNGTMNGKATQSLVEDTNGEVAHGDLSHNSVLGMSLYLSGHS